MKKYSLFTGNRIINGKTRYLNLPKLEGDATPLGIDKQGNFGITEGSGGTTNVDWNDIENKPSEFKPESHTHDIEDITDLESKLVAKADVVHTHDASDIVSGILDIDRLPQLPQNRIINLQSILESKADLGDNGKVIESQLPTYIDNVQEEDSISLFPTEGLSNVIYLDTSANIPYRWSGTTYVAISSGLALGETSSTSYRGDRGKIAYDHSLRTDNPHQVTKTQVGLSNVNNTSDANKPISNATQTALNGKQAKLRGAISPAIPAVRQALGSLTAVASGTYFTINNLTYGYDIYSLKSDDAYVIPAWASHARVTATVNINNLNSESVLEGRITRNGGIVSRATTRGSGNAVYPAATLDTGIIPVASGDKFEIQVWHNNGDSRNLSPSLTFINIELFESI